MLFVPEVNRLHRDMVVRWHQQEIDNPFEGVHAMICEQHAYNYRLWHEEDIARSPDVGDARIAQVKRNIDQLNQQRNDRIEKIDDWVTGELLKKRVTPQDHAGLNTETPGSAVDRLSILSLRIYHLEEQLDRVDVDESHVEACKSKLAICHRQQQDLSQSLQELVQDIFSGAKRHQTYRQMKMYNDPGLNPYLYQQHAA